MSLTKLQGSDFEGNAADPHGGQVMILCCGEALMDMVPTDPTAAKPSFAALPGGAIFNTAIALGRMEIPVCFCSGMSYDLFGAQLVDELHASGVDTDLLIRSDRPTTLAFVKLTNAQAQYTFYDENTAGRMITAGDLPEIGADISALYFGGISLCAEPAASAYEALVLREAEHAVVMLDPNIRPGFIEDEPSYRARLDRMIEKANVIKVSEEDLAWMVPGSAAGELDVDYFQNKGVALVIVTKGADGAVAYSNGQPAVKVGAPDVTVADTVGAGDTFNAGFLAHLHTNGLLQKDGIGGIGTEDLRQALEYATKVAAVTVSRSGANPPYLTEL